MAFSGEAEQLTWDRVEKALRNGSPCAQQEFRELKRWFANHKLAPQLQFVAFDRTTNGSDGSNADTVICSAACTLVGWYAKKNSTGVVAAYLKISNHASAIQAQGEVIQQGATAGIEFMMNYCTNTAGAMGLALATGATLATVTAYNGTTHSLKADSYDGFVIIAA